MQVDNQIEQEPQIEPLVDPKGASTWYDVLEVSPRASEAVIQAAYRTLARSAHPDLNRQRSAAERMRELNQARDILLNPRRRAIYDLNIGQQRATPVTDGKGTTVRRAHTCWRCEQALSAYSAYCGRCRWLVCESCRGCGCQHPDWQPPSTQTKHRQHPLLERAGPLTRLGWLLVGGLIGLIGVVGTGVWTVALR